MTTPAIKTHELGEPASSLGEVSCGMCVASFVLSPEWTLRSRPTLKVVEGKFPGTRARRATFAIVA